MRPTPYCPSLLLALFLLLATEALAVDRRGRLGLGLSNELKMEPSALSFKLQQSRALALGALVGFSSAEDQATLGLGLKLYRNIFQEPLLHFYSSLLVAGVRKKTHRDVSTKTGFQCDLTLGSEFSFAGLQALGISMEAGLSFHKFDEFIIETVGKSAFMVAAMHFYL